MSVKISPFNVHTVKKYGMNKVLEMDRQHRESKQNKDVTPEVTEVETPSDEVLMEDLTHEVLEQDLPIADEAEDSSEEYVTEEAEESFEQVEAASTIGEEDDSFYEESSSASDDLELLSEDDLRTIAKELGISHWWTKGGERLIEEIKEARAE